MEYKKLSSYHDLPESKSYEGYWFSFFQVLPVMPDFMDMVFFPIKPNNSEEAHHYYCSLGDDIKRLVHFKKENEKWKNFYNYYPMPDENKAYFWLELVADKVYLKYRDLFDVVVNFSDLVEDTHFFMDNEWEAWIDEYLITEGKLTAKRYIAQEPFYFPKLRVLEILAAEQKQYVEFQTALSNMFCFTGRIDIDMQEIEEIDNNEIEESIDHFNKALSYNPDNQKAKELKVKFKNHLAQVKNKDV